jgi:hypothetical protein
MTAATEPAPSSTWIERSGMERRSGADQRRDASIFYLSRGGRERRSCTDRRQSAERRDGWLQIAKWRSVLVFDSGK